MTWWLEFREWLFKTLFSDYYESLIRARKDIDYIYRRMEYFRDEISLQQLAEYRKAATKEDLD